MRIKSKIIRNPYIRVLFFALLAIGLVAAIIIGISFLKNFFFSKNPHFIIKEIKVSSIGYWNNRVDDIENIINIKRGQTNLFDVNLANTRAALIDKKELGIQDAEIIRELPNTLSIKIYERIPSALLFSKKSNIIVDQNGYIINKKYAKDVSNQLPVITGFKLRQGAEKTGSIKFGTYVPAVKPAIVFLSLINTEYPEFEVKSINLYNPNELGVFMVGPNKKIVKVIFPFPYSVDAPPNQKQINTTVKILRIKLNELKNLYRYLTWKNEPFSEINMLYNEQAIVR